MFEITDPRFWYKCGIILIFFMGGTGVTLTAKWANLIKAKGDSGEIMEFRHSFIQVRKVFNLKIKKCFESIINKVTYSGIIFYTPTY